jgi:hypothetical protein
MHRLGVYALQVTLRHFWVAAAAAQHVTALISCLLALHAHL